MAIEIVLPSLAAGMEDGVIAQWLKAEGDDVVAGDPVAEVETDKATMEIEAPGSGRLGRILVAAGKRADVNQVIAVILAEGEENVEMPASPKPVAQADKGSPVAVTVPARSSGPAVPRHSASPLARRLAAEHGVELSGLSGSGPKGRIVRLDVEHTLADRSSTRVPPLEEPGKQSVPDTAHVPLGIGDYEVLPLSSMRRTIARRLHEAKTTVPHFYLEAECEMAPLIALRAQCNEGREAGARLSINDFVVKAVALALRAVPDMRCIWNQEALLRPYAVDVAVAVATEGGLITPILRDADRKSLGSLSEEIRSLSVRARDGRLKPEEYQGGCFSVSNLGMYGVKNFSAIINPPQSGILAVGAVTRRPVERGDAIAFSEGMNCTLSVDHRAVDGAVGAQWLAAFKNGIENPMSLLV